ncbi:alkaline phosphatase family protein [Nocardioides pocheonensis]|nr:alkaline phosphatase family protein [Nocardioides pocheonensis]
MINRPDLRTRRHLSAVALVAALAVLAALTSAGGGAAAAPRATRPGSTAPPNPAITKVLVFMVENHSLDQMTSSMPFVHGLAQQYAYATNYTAITHPSLPNYLAILGGSTFGVTDDRPPAAHRLRGASVLSQARRAGRTVKVYAESQPRRCALANAGEYAVRHNPWTYFVSDRTACRRYDVMAGALGRNADAGTLPNVGMVIPNLVHDAHDASLATSDAWLSKKITRIQAGPDWQSGRLAVVITADEDDHHQGNTVLTVVASRYQQHKVVGTPLTHYSLTRLLEDVAGVPYLRNAATAASMTTAFGISTLPRP